LYCLFAFRTSIARVICAGKLIKIYLLTAIFLFGLANTWAENISIAQIDSSHLLLDQSVGVYVSVTDRMGEPVKGLLPEHFTVYESPDGKEYSEVSLLKFTAQAGKNQGMHFLLLIDNSGSMYDTLKGKPTDKVKDMRISVAKGAVRTFINTMSNPKDTIGLASFNTNYTLHSTPSGERLKIEKLLDSIERPEKQDAYTELYAGLLFSSEDMSTVPGRKVVVVLSDGENFPYFSTTGEMHPEFKDRIYEYSEPILNFQKEGISLFAINFGRTKDRYLERIAIETGGAVFDAASERELAEIYMAIKKRVLNEYLLTTRGSMQPAERMHIRVDFNDGKNRATAARFYFSSTIFGLPLDSLTPLLLIPLLAALLIWLILSKVRFAKLNTRPNLEVLQSDRGFASTQMITLDSNKTVIGGSDNADLTISGVPEVKQNHATIVFDRNKKQYTVVAEGDITVNNRQVKRKTLEAGDVINVGGTTIVFDDDDFSSS
jgi:Ca-activated chloride channel family protein